MLDQPSVDPERLALVGNSFRGYLAFAGAAADPRHAALVSISPLIDPSESDFPQELFDEFAPMLKGVTGAELKAQWDTLPAIGTMKEKLRGTPKLPITADQDELFPPAHYEAIAAELDELLWERIPKADHVFSALRKQLVRLTIDWLIETLGD